MKRVTFCNILLLVLVTMVAASCSGKKQHAEGPCISIADFTSDNLLVSGSYGDLIQRMGNPVKQFEQAITVKKDGSGDKSSVSIPLLQYDGVTYCRRDDSVQLVFIDLRKSGKQLTFQLGDGTPLTLDSATLCDTFYDYMDAQLYKENHLKAIPDEEKLTFDPHYNVDGLYYVVTFKCNSNDTNNLSYITPVFLPQTRKLWYIEFSPFDSKGLYREIVN